MDSHDKVPQTLKDFIARFPELDAAHEQAANAVDKAGPMDARVCSPIEMGICIGAGLEPGITG